MFQFNEQSVYLHTGQSSHHLKFNFVQNFFFDSTFKFNGWCYDVCVFDIVHCVVCLKLCAQHSLVRTLCVVDTVQGPAQYCAQFCTVFVHSCAISAQRSQNFVCTALHSVVHSFAQSCAQSFALLCYKVHFVCTAMHSLVHCAQGSLVRTCND